MPKGPSKEGWNFSPSKIIIMSTQRGGTIGFWAYPQTIFTTAFGHDILCVETVTGPGRSTVQGQKPSRERDFQYSDGTDTNTVFVWVNRESRVVETSGMEMGHSNEDGGLVRRWWKPCKYYRSSFTNELQARNEPGLPTSWK